MSVGRKHKSKKNHKLNFRKLILSPDGQDGDEVCLGEGAYGKVIAGQLYAIHKPYGFIKNEDDSAEIIFPCERDSKLMQQLLHLADESQPTQIYRSG